MRTTLLHNPRCSKSRATLALLIENGVDPDIVEYLKNPPSRSELEAILEKLGMEPHDILRTEEAREAGISHLTADLAEGSLWPRSSNTRPSPRWHSCYKTMR